MEKLRLRTEVIGLELELEGNVLALVLNGTVELIMPLRHIEAVENAKSLLQLKDQPGMNYFDRVESTVRKSIELTQ